MAIAFVPGQSAHAENGGSGGSIAVTLTGITAGNTIVGACTFADNVTLSNIKDQSGTSALIDEQRDCTNESQWLVIWSFPNCPGGSRTFTATFSGTANSNRGIQCFEFSGMPTTGALTGTPTGNDSGAGTASAFDASSSTTPGANGSLIFAYGEGNSNQPSAAGSFTQGIQDTVNLITTEYLVQGAAAAIAPSFTMGAADKWCVVIAAYQPAVAGSGNDVVVRYGNVGQTSGSGLLTAPFLSTAVATLGGGYYLTRRRLDAMTTWEDL